MNVCRTKKNALRGLLDLACLTPLGALGVIFLAILPIVPPFNHAYLIRYYIGAAIIGASAIADFSGGYLGIINFGFMAFFGWDPTHRRLWPSISGSRPGLQCLLASCRPP